ncbi:MAG: HD domain-containing protein [Candidatus Acetothermia bacterium]
MSEKRDLEGMVKFVFELGQLKRLPRSGWLKLGIEDPESVAEHSFRTGVIGYLLAVMEGYDPHKVAGYCLLHDIAETRTGDLDWLAQRYLDRGDYLSSEVLEDQLENLPEEVEKTMKQTFDEFKGEEVLKRIARDADLLELAFQALEYEASGNQQSGNWFENTVTLLKTDSGKRLGNLLRKHYNSDSLENLLGWWREGGFKEGRGN